jgi:hypothetical protein
MSVVLRLHLQLGIPPPQALHVSSRVCQSRIPDSHLFKGAVQLLRHVVPLPSSFLNLFVHHVLDRSQIAAMPPVLKRQALYLLPQRPVKNQYEKFDSENQGKFQRISHVSPFCLPPSSPSLSSPLSLAHLSHALASLASSLALLNAECSSDSESAYAAASDSAWRRRLSSSFARNS